MSNLDSDFIGISTEEEAISIVCNEPNIIASFPEFLLTDNVLFESLSRSFDAYNLVNEVFFSDELVQRLLLDNIRCFDLIPADKIKKHHILAVAKQDGMNIAALPKHYLNVDVCITAILSNPESHEFVPLEYQTSDYINELVKSKPEFVSRIDVSKRISSTIKSLVKVRPELLRFLPMNERDFDLCVQAVKDDPTLVQYTPEDIYDDAKYVSIIADMDYFKHPTGVLNAELIRQPLADLLFKNDPNIFRLLPDHVKKEEMCQKAIDQDKDNIFFVPIKLKQTGDIWEYCLRQYPDMYIYPPIEEQNDKVRLFIAKQNAMSKSNKKAVG